MPNGGYITASRFKDVMANGRGTDTFGATAITYLNELTIAWFGVNKPEFKSEPTEHGKELEDTARTLYQQRTSMEVYNPGWHQIEGTIIGGTTDGFVNEDGIIEIKCPFNPMKHFANLNDDAFVDEYYTQVQGYLYITGRKWCDMVSYDGRYPDISSQLHIVHIVRDEEFISTLADRLNRFQDMLIASVSAFASKFNYPNPLPYGLREDQE